MFVFVPLILLTGRFFRLSDSAYTLITVFMRVARARGVWSYWVPLMLVLALPAAYEIIEWLVAVRVDPAAGLAFLGAQGDVWDAQKDMVLALIGAAVTLLVVALISWRRDRASAGDFRVSLKVGEAGKPLGEAASQALHEDKHKSGASRQAD